MRLVRIKLILVSTVIGLAALSHAPAALAACAPNTANLGQVTGSFTIGTTGTYRVWSRMSVPDTTNNSYTLEIDGTQCNITVGDTLANTNSWQWVDYRDGNTASKINITLSAGTHTYTMYGREPNVKVDRVVFAADPTCGGSGPVLTGDNCLSAPPDTQAPTTPTNLTASAKTTSTVTLGWTQSTDNTAVTSYKVYRNGASTPVGTVNYPTTTFVNTGLTAATSYNYQVSAMDAAGNESTKSTILTVITAVSAPPPDTQAPTVPTVTLTSKSAINVVIAWTTSTDNSGTVSGYNIYRNGSTTPLTSVTGATHSFNDTSVTANTAYTYQVSAFDAVPNTSTKSTALSVTTNPPTVAVVGDIAQPPDGHVTGRDLSSLLLKFGTTSYTGPEDINGDHVVNGRDLSILLIHFGS